MKPNPGYCPREAIGKRVRVTLANGIVVVSPGWPADGKGACRWTLLGRPHDIAEFEVIP